LDPIQQGTGGGAEGVGLWRRSKPSANGILLDVPHAVDELLFAHDLALVEAAHPHIRLALQAERETALDELHGLFKRHIGGGRDQSVEMVRHDDECVQKEPSLAAIVEDGLQKQFRGGRDLKKAVALRGHSGDKIRSSFLRRESHIGSINEMPVAKATLLRAFIQGPEGPCSLRRSGA